MLTLLRKCTHLWIPQRIRGCLCCSTIIHLWNNRVSRLRFEPMFSHKNQILSIAPQTARPSWLCYIDVNAITQMHASMNSSQDAWMFMLFGEGHPCMKQQSCWRMGFEPMLSHKNLNLRLTPKTTRPSWLCI